MSLSLNVKLTDYRLGSRAVLELQPLQAEQGHAEQVPYLGHDGEPLFHGRSPPDPLPFTRSDSTTGRKDSHLPNPPVANLALKPGFWDVGPFTYPYSPECVEG
jgi:hypothetical protein